MRSRRARPGLLVVLALLACGGDTTGNGGGGGGDEDPCGNAVGNGNRVVPGPGTVTSDDHDQPFRSLVVDPADPEIVYIGTERNGIVRSRDGGRTWERLRQGLRHGASGYGEVWDIAVAPGNTSLLIAATTDSPGPLTGAHPSTIGGVYRSSDAGTTWQRANCGLSNASIASVRFARGSATTVVIGVSAGRATFSGLAGQFFTGGLFRSTDAGRNWTRALAPPGADRNQYWQIALAGGANTLYTFGVNFEDPSQSIGFLDSQDNGTNWLPLPDGLSGRFIDGFAVSNDGRTIYANDRNTFRMLRTRDGGATWSEVGAFANGVVAVSPADADLVLFEDFGTLRRSTNGLLTFNIVVNSARRFDDIEFAASDPRIVYAVTEGYDVYRSDNAGATFRLLVNLRTSVLR